MTDPVNIYSNYCMEQRMNKQALNDTLQLIQKKNAVSDNRKKQVPLSDRPEFKFCTRQEEGAGFLNSRPEFKSCLHSFVVATTALNPTIPLVKER